MPAKTDPRDVSGTSRYYYRRALSTRDLLPAIGAGVAVGLAAFYLVRVMLEREPLVPERGAAAGARSSRPRDRQPPTRVRGG
jgi:hypothetical protein